MYFNKFTTKSSLCKVAKRRFFVYYGKKCEEYIKVRFMFKIWAKIIDENRRIKKDYLFVSNDNFDERRFFDYMVEICEKLDIATPAILPYHVNNFKEFSFVKFLPRDFVEYVDFAYLTLEYAKDEKKKKRDTIV